MARNKRLVKSKNNSSSNTATAKSGKVVKRQTERSTKKKAETAKLKLTVKDTKVKRGVNKPLSQQIKPKDGSTKAEVSNKTTPKDKKMSLRGKKRSYAELANGINSEDKTQTKRQKVSKTNETLFTPRGGRSKKPTAKASEWLNTISSKKQKISKKEVLPTHSKGTPRKAASPKKPRKSNSSTAKTSQKSVKQTPAKRSLNKSKADDSKKTMKNKSPVTPAKTSTKRSRSKSKAEDLTPKKPVSTSKGRSSKSRTSKETPIKQSTKKSPRRSKTNQKVENESVDSKATESNLGENVAKEILQDILCSVVEPLHCDSDKTIATEAISLEVSAKDEQKESPVNVIKEVIDGMEEKETASDTIKVSNSDSNTIACEAEVENSELVNTIHSASPQDITEISKICSPSHELMSKPMEDNTEKKEHINGCSEDKGVDVEECAQINTSPVKNHVGSDFITKQAVTNGNNDNDEGKDKCVESSTDKHRQLALKSESPATVIENKTAENNVATVIAANATTESIHMFEREKHAKVSAIGNDHHSDVLEKEANDEEKLNSICKDVSNNQLKSNSLLNLHESQNMAESEVCKTSTINPSKIFEDTISENKIDNKSSDAGLDVNGSIKDLNDEDSFTLKLESSVDNETEISTKEDEADIADMRKEGEGRMSPLNAITLEESEKKVEQEVTTVRSSPTVDRKNDSISEESNHSQSLDIDNAVISKEENQSPIDSSSIVEEKLERQKEHTREENEKRQEEETTARQELATPVIIHEENHSNSIVTNNSQIPVTNAENKFDIDSRKYNQTYENEKNVCEKDATEPVFINEQVESVTQHDIEQEKHQITNEGFPTEATEPVSATCLDKKLQEKSTLHVPDETTSAANNEVREELTSMDVAEDSPKIDKVDCESMVCNSETSSSNRMSVDEENACMDMDPDDGPSGNLGQNFQGRVESEIMEVS